MAVRNWGPTIKIPKPGTPPPPASAPDPRLPGFTDWLKGQREGDMAAGAAWADGKFGASNPEMKGILDTLKQRSLGLNSEETGLMRSRGVQGINSQLATGLRQLKGAQNLPGGVRGGAAVGQALPTLAKANLARSDLESNIATADMDRRRQGLQDYASLLTGERSGALGAELGFAGLGAQDRAGGMQYLLGKDWITAAQNAVNGGGGTPLSPPQALDHALGRDGPNPARPKYDWQDVDDPTNTNSDGNRYTPWRRWG